MAYQARLAKWLTDRRKDFELSIREFTWPLAMGSSLSDFEVTLLHEGNASVGRGTDLDPNLALEKACAEALERLVCSEHGVSSIGIALHTNSIFARVNARLEFIERHVLGHHVESVAPATFSHKSQLRLLGDDSRCEHTLYRLKTCGAFSTALCVISYRSIRLIGAAADFNFSRAASRAELEAARNLAAFVSAPELFRKAVSGDSNYKWSDEDYFYRKIAPILTGQTLTSELHMPAVKYRKLQLPKAQKFEDCPAVVVQAYEKSAV